MTKIVVLLATYNGVQFIEEQLESILNQEGVDVSIIASDDNSTDSTFEKLQMLAEKKHKISVMQNIPGSGSAANNFLQMISTLNFAEEFDFVSFADQDDIWLPEKLKAASDLLLKNNGDLYFSNLTKWHVATGEFSLLKKDFPQKKFDHLFEGGGAGCTYVFTKKFAQDLAMFLQNVNSKNWEYFSHDWLVYFFARSRKHKVVSDANSYIEYRIHENNVHGHLNTFSWATVKAKSAAVLSGYYQGHAKNFILHLENTSEEYKIYKAFLGNYWSRNFMILRYNTQLMRDKKKFIMFAFLNLLKIN